MQITTVVDDFFGLCRRIRRGVVLVFNMKCTVAPDNGGGSDAQERSVRKKCSKEVYERSVRKKCTKEVYERSVRKPDGKGQNLRMEEDVRRERVAQCLVKKRFGEKESLVVGTDNNSRTYFEFTSFPPWLAAFLAMFD